ncbi:gamma-glutamyltransferase [Pigmentiphaga aceris]|uniref:gamma-glutamyltransferase n=1 Tax=Pigmentiphaga aceris TaxID=1940612 RepID=UPI003CCC4AA8
MDRSTPIKRALLVATLSLTLWGCTSTPQQSALPVQPEGASGYTPKPGWATQRFAVAAANPLATEAGYRVLKAGGSAVDAAIAVQMVLALVEPQSSGIGGGAFLLHYDGQHVSAFDGRETAPVAVDPQLFLGPDGKPIPFKEAVIGGRSVGVPGAVAMLEVAHREHGKLPWADLFEPAIKLARGGFTVSPRLASAIKNDADLKKDAVAAAYFYRTDGTPLQAGDTLRNPELATVLSLIAKQGSRGLLQGEVAQAIVDKVRNHPTNPGRMTLADLANYVPRQREALCHDYRAPAADTRICGFPPPSSGAIAIGQILGIVARTDATALPLQDGLPSADWLHNYAEASRLAFADRAQYVGDPDFVQAPGGSWSTLLAPAYLDERARLIMRHSMGTAKAGTPAPAAVSYAPMPDQPEYGTSHISIVDAAGNAIAMTTTIEGAFGSHLMVRGFMLNNELTDFSFTPTDAQGRPVANRVEPGKRPRSSMAPTLVFDRASGKLLMSAGSPGGALIIHFTAKTLYGALNWQLDAQRAIDLPNFGTVGGPMILEAGRFPAATVDALKARGQDVRETEMTSGLQAIERRGSGWYGGADPRREGVVMGE